MKYRYIKAMSFADRVEGMCRNVLGDVDTVQVIQQATYYSTDMVAKLHKEQDMTGLEQHVKEGSMQLVFGIAKLCLHCAPRPGNICGEAAPWRTAWRQRSGRRRGWPAVGEAFQEDIVPSNTRR